MFGRARRAKSEQSRPTSVPDGSAVWAVGDIHGQDDLFDVMASAIAYDVEASAAARRVVVLLGDYVDRGLGSSRVVDRIFELRTKLDSLDAELVLLKGNHEDLLLRFIDNPSTGPAWMAVGGSETLLSYGIQPPATNDAQGWEATSNTLLVSMPLEHLLFYEGLEHHHQEGDYHFVHAGVRYGVALEEQAPEDMLWIRDTFLKETRSFDKVIVHGHTPGPEVFVDHRRICLDTGSYATGVLTAMRLEGSARVVLQSRRSHGKVKFQVSQLPAVISDAP